MRGLSALRLAPPPGLVAVDVAEPLTAQSHGHYHPQWYVQLCLIAATALEATGTRGIFTPYATPSCWSGHFEGNLVVLEPVINGESFDETFLKCQFGDEASVLIGLSDDKDVASVVLRLVQLGYKRLYAAALFSEAEHVSSHWIENNPWGVQTLGEIDVVRPTLDDVRTILRKLGGPVYVIGVQVFIRSVRLALGVELVGGTNNE